jgi:PAS domain S-box-containing protein
MADPDLGSLDLLHVEDSVTDAELVCDAVHQAGYRSRWRRVEDEAMFRAALDERLPDVILSDWTLPRFSGRAALTIARERCPEVPFLYVTGTMAESCAIDALRQGANDYVYKHQLSLLGPALARILAEARERRQHLQAEAERHRLSEALRQTLQPIVLTDVEGRITFVNPAFTHLFGYGIEDLRGESTERLCLPDEASRAERRDLCRYAGETGNWSGELLRQARDGTALPVFANIGMVTGADGAATGFVSSYFDLRPLKESERQLAAAAEQRSHLERQLHQSQKMDAIGQLTGGIAP